MPDRLAQYVRTYWPLAIGHLAAVVTAWLAAHLGLTVDSLVVYELLALALTAAVYAAGDWLSRRDGDGALARLARVVGRWLLSLGLDTGRPVYVRPGKAVVVDE